MSKLIEPQGYLGDMAEDQTFYFWFTSCNKDGASIAITAIGSTVVYRDVSSISVAAGITITQDADGVTGCHRVEVILSDSDFLIGYDYRIVQTGMTVDAETLNVTLCEFSIENRLK